jgi:hypothetical protein
MTLTPAPPLLAKAPRPTGTAIGACGPLVLIGLYGYLSTSRGTRAFDDFASRNVGTGLFALAMLGLVIGGTLLVGLLASLWAVWRGERPRWLPRILLAVHVVAVLLVLRAVW